MNTNTALIPVTEGTIQGRAQHLCDARDLHAFLEVRRDFTNWIKQRIAKYGFVENQDFVCFEDLSSPNLASSKARQQITKQYHLTLDMAKELSMVENNERGHQARRFFIECERVARAGKVPIIPAPMGDPSHHKALISTTDEEAFWRAFKKHAATLKDAPLAWQNGGLLATRIALESAGCDVGVRAEIYAPWIVDLPTYDQTATTNPFKINGESWKAILSVRVYGKPLGAMLEEALAGEKKEIADLESQLVSLRDGFLFVGKSPVAYAQHPAVSALHDLIRRTPDAICARVRMGRKGRLLAGVMITIGNTPLSSSDFSEPLACASSQTP